MKIECISKSAKNLPAELIRPELGLKPDLQFALVVGKQYVVYGMTVFLGHLWYYICDEDYTYYPIWNPSLLFKIVDPRLSSYWRIGFHAPDPTRDASPIIAFEQWVNDPAFYERLTDGQESTVQVFAKCKRLMDEE